MEFSHAIPERTLKVLGGWAENVLGRSPLNGNYVTIAEHALMDPKRYQFMSKVWKASNPLPHRLVQLWNRIPALAKGISAGAAYGLAALTQNNCECSQ
jgi:hypothetical protein